jgi:hypothetical protein
LLKQRKKAKEAEAMVNSPEFKRKIKRLKRPQEKLKKKLKK